MDRTDIRKIWIDNDAIWIETCDGKQGCEFLSEYTRLRQADRQDLNKYVLSYYGIHWPELDEDLSFDGFFKNSNLSQYNV